MTRSNFFHLECYAQAGSRNAYFVLGEAARDPDACRHVKTPQAPILISGPPLADLRNQTTRLAAAARETTGSGRARRIRRHQHILLGAVASYPVQMAELQDAAAKCAYETWRKLAADFMQRLAAPHGALCTIVAHHDEKFPHLHALIVPTDPAMRAKLVHPGYAARLAEESRGAAAGLPASEAVRNGRRAWGKAMRGLQDRYHAEVGALCGHSRLLFGRARLQRGEILALRAVHDARDEAVLARDQAERDRTVIAAAAEQEGYKHGYEKGRHVAEAAVADDLDELRQDLSEANSQIAILHKAWTDTERTRTVLEETVLDLRREIAGLLTPPEEQADLAVGYGYGG
jgi:hypothetical protein